MNTAASDLLTAGGGILAFVLLIVLLVNGLLWLFLPFVLISKLNAINRRLAAIETAAEGMADVLTGSSKGKQQSSVRYNATG